MCVKCANVNIAQCDANMRAKELIGTGEDCQMALGKLISCRNTMAISVCKECCTANYENKEKVKCARSPDGSAYVMLTLHLCYQCACQNALQNDVYANTSKQ